MSRPTRNGLSRLALGLAWVGAAALGCKPATDVEAPEVSETRGAGTDRVGTSAGSLATVNDGDLEPDAEQVAAGVPYLRFFIALGDSPRRGPADAPVTIVMFSDFECPYCEQALATVAELERDYPGQLRFVYKAMPLANHPNAMVAALIGHSAQAQGKFWAWHDLVFSGRGISQDILDRYIAELGLDAGKIERELEELTYAPEVRGDLRVAKRLKLRSTPIFFVNGRMLSGARPKPVFSHLVEQELSMAEGLAERGVVGAAVYEYAIQWGYTALRFEGERPELDEDTVFPVPVGDSVVRGRADAPVTIVAFSDFQCPFCARGHEAMEALRARYGEDIRFVFKHFPLPGHPLGALASRASFAALEAGKFWEFHDAVFALGGRYGADDLLEIGAELGIDRQAMEDALMREDNDAVVQADLDLGVRLGVTGTPAYFINGRPIVGAHPILDFRMLIVEELARVAEARAQGVPAAEIYRHLTGVAQGS